MQNLQARLECATGKRGRLRRELDRRLEIAKRLKQKIADF
jgi:hypothetical protein